MNEVSLCLSLCVFIMIWTGGLVIIWIGQRYAGVPHTLNQLLMLFSNEYLGEDAGQALDVPLGGVLFQHVK